MTTKEKEEILRKTGGAPIGEGIVYVIESFGYFKIGSTTNLKKRLRCYDTHNPEYHLCFSFKSNDCRGFEKSLHILFRKRKLKNEWFKLDISDFEKIMELNEYLFDKQNKRVLPRSKSYDIVNKR